MSPKPEESCSDQCGISKPFDRRGFLQFGSASVATVMLSEVFGGNVAAQDANRTAQLATYPKIKIASLSDAKVDQPIEFAYPNNNELHTGAMLIRLGRNAGGGVGPNNDIVAFNTRCTHMGGNLTDGYITQHKLLGCGEHLTTFDLTRHGLVVAGHATQALPQIVLTIDNNDIFATGIVGLLYGHHQNPTEPE
jgi:arsenite oxidase small subunit